MSVEIRHPTVGHVDGMFQLINRLAAKGQMLPRSKYQIVTSLANFLVAVDGPTVVGCGAFVPLWTDIGEIRSTAVDEARQGQGVGRLLVEGLIQEGRRMEIPEIFVLTYQVGFWAKLGFEVTDKDRFPRKIWRECLECPKLEACDETAMHLMLS